MSTWEAVQTANAGGMSVETRQRLIAAAERGLRWRREKIMIARLTMFWLYWFVHRQQPDWHSLFECERHGHHPLRAEWVGPYEFRDTIDTSGGSRETT